MTVWSAEIKELAALCEALRGNLPDLEKELDQLIKTEDANVVMLYSRRCLEVMVTDLCERELKRPRKTEPLKGIIDKLNREEKVPEHIITSMHSLNSLSTFGAHPKEFDPQQVRPVLVNLSTTLKWYLKHKKIKYDLKAVEPEYTEQEEIKEPVTVAKSKKKPVVLISGLLLVCAVVVVALVVFNVIGDRKSANSITKLKKSIAVLPFENWNSDEEYVHLGDAMANEIITQLTKIKDFHVISFTSTQQFKGRDKPTVPEIGKELGADFIIEGSVERQKEDVSITVQVIQAESDHHLWADVFKGKWENIFTLRAEIAVGIAGKLETVLSPEETRQIEYKSTANSEAYYHYIIGNHFHFQLDFTKAIDHYQHAIALDSCFAEAYAALASSYLYLGSWHVTIPTSDSLLTVKDLVDKALNLDKNLAEAYFVLGNIYKFYEWDWIDAEKAFKKSLELNPNFIFNRLEYANFLTFMGRFEESIELGWETVNLDPLSPLVNNELGFALFLSGQDEDALVQYNKSLELNPGFDMTIALLMQVYTKQGLYEKALTYWEELTQLYNDISEVTTFDIAQAGYIYGLAGQRDEAMNCLNELNRRIEEEQLQHTSSLAFVYIGLGEYEKAIEYLEKGYNDGDWEMVSLKVLFWFDPIRSEEGFKELLRKMGFEE